MNAPLEILIKNLQASPLPDGRRVRVSLELNPQEPPPTLDLRILNSEGEVVSRILFVETAEPRLTFTMHIRGNPAVGRYELAASFLDPSNPPQAPVKTEFTIKPFD